MSEKDMSTDRVQHGEERSSKIKGSSHLYDGGQEETEEEEEEVMAAMCHSSETYSAIHQNRAE